MFGKIFKKKIKTASFDVEVPKIIVGKHGAGSESYYRLRDNVIYCSDNGKNKIFQIESSVSGEGKTTVTSNLAVALAQCGKKVVVVDLDFHRPKLHRVFSFPNFNGLAEYMLGECKKSELIKHTEYGVDVINRGKAAYNTSAIFTSNNFANLLEELKKEYDIVLMDCPPVLLVSDYIHLSKVSDAVMFVVSCGVTHRAQLKDSLELLKRSHNNISGIILTYKNNGKFGLKYSDRYYSGMYYRDSKNEY